MTDGRTWNASTYHTQSGPMVEMARRVLERLPLRGDETVLDAGCGTGRVTALLLDRLPRGRVIAADADPDMVRVAQQELAIFGDRVVVEQLDLLSLDLDEAVDAVLSTATFHWILDHDALFANLFRALRPGGQLVAQCGGFGNIRSNLAAAEEASRDPRWAERFEGWSRPNLYATPEETSARLEAAGFVEVNCWLEPNPVVPDDPRSYMETITIGAHVQRLETQADRDAFMDEVMARMAQPITIDYVRLNIDARKP